MSKSIEAIEGIGPKTGATLRKAGVRTVEKLLDTGCTKAGLFLWLVARAI